MDLVIPDASKTLREGALAPWILISSNYYPAMLEQAMEQFGVDMDTPFEDLKKEEQDLILYGSGDREFHFHYVNDFGGVRDIDIPFEGVVTNINRRYHETNSDFTRNVMRGYMNELSCPTCHGYRLNEAALSVRCWWREWPKYWSKFLICLFQIIFRQSIALNWGKMKE